MGRLRSYLRRYLHYYVIGFFFLTVTNGLGLIAPWIFKVAVDTLTLLQKASASGLKLGAPDVAFLANAAIAAAAILILMGVFRVLSRIFIFYNGRRVEADLRNDLFERLLKMDARFYQEMPTGELMSRAVNDINYVRALSGFGLLNFMNTVTMGALVISRMAALSPLLTLYSILPLPALVMSIRYISRGLFKRSIEVQEGLADLSSFIQEDLTGLSAIQAYAREDGERKRFGSINDEYLEQNLGLARMRSSVAGVMVAYGGIGSAIVLGLGGHSVISGEMTIGALLAFGIYLTMLTWPTMALGWMITVVQRGMASMKRINEILDRQPDIKAPAGSRTTPLKGDIRFKGLGFKYPQPLNHSPGKRPFELKDIEVHIKQGTRAAIVGLTGAGKSTMVKTIPRLIEATEGALQIDGAPIEGVSLEALRRSIGFVSQEPFLFSATIHSNVAMGRDSPASQDVHEAIRRAGLGPDMEEFPMGDKTVVGERGVTLSGGQRQRVALARTLLANPNILILDDVFSSVDAQTEKYILQELKEFMKGRTSMVITHRLSAIRDFDVILVMDSGEIVERGDHDELMARGGLYKKLVEKQAIEEELEQL